MKQRTPDEQLLWDLRALAQKIPEGHEIDRGLATLQAERAKVRAILDAMHTQVTDDMSLIDLAEAISALFADLERDHTTAIDRLEMLTDGSCASDGYHAFATSFDWKYSNGEPMPAWAQLDYATQNAFLAFAKAIVEH